MTDFLGSLNPEQREAVEHFEGPILVLAGAGSGKTRVLTTRVWRLIREHGVPPGRIMAVTFTNKAAGEMRERIAAMLGEGPVGLWVGTFHAIGARILRRHAPELGWTRGFAIRDAEQALREVKRAQKAAQVDAKRWSPKALRAAISDAKNQLIGAEAFSKDHADGSDLMLRTAARVYPVYQKALREQDAMDFDDLLMLPVRLLEASDRLRERYQERFAFVLVDEYQDTNRAQFRFLELLAERHRNLMVVGDDDQSIYGWRGADIRNILDFERSFPGAQVVRLEQNYRSTPVILAAANAVIRQNRRRKHKTMRTARVGGEPVTCTECADEMDEARWIVEEIERLMLAQPELGHGDFAVLYRTNAQSRALEERFLRRRVPYQIVGGVRFYERREIQDAVAYLRLAANPRDVDAFARIVNYPRRGVGRVSLERLAAFAEGRGIGLLEAAGRAAEVPRLPGPARKGLAGLAALVGRHAAMADMAPVGAVLQSLVEALDLVPALRREGPEGDDRAENLQELLAAAAEFDAEAVMDLDAEDLEGFTDLALFLQQAALVADVDSHDSGADAVTLMTAHSAKGLEFPVVLVSGLEEGLFPLARAYDEEGLLEEERRLFYVAMTRAREQLKLTWARSRRRAGQRQMSGPSSFLESLDDMQRSRTRRARTSGGWSRDGWSRSSDWTSGGSGRSSGTGHAGGGWDGGPQPDPYNQDRPRYVKGERVVHATFGSGVITELTGFGPDMKVTVDFGSAGRKRLVVRYAGLERDYAW